jgi:hypothetical protein
MISRSFILTAAYFVFYIFICLVFVAFFAMLFCITNGLLYSGLEAWRGCAPGQHEILSDEEAVRIVKGQYLTQNLLEKHPMVLNSEEYVHGLGMFSGYRKGHRGGWSVQRRRVDLGSREILDVDFSYRFPDTGTEEVYVECSMGRCSPNPECRYMGN